MYVRMHKCTHAGYLAHGYYQVLRSCDFAQKLKVKEMPPVPKTTDLRNNSVKWTMATNTMSLTQLDQTQLPNAIETHSFTN